MTDNDTPVDLPPEQVEQIQDSIRFSVERFEALAEAAAKALAESFERIRPGIEAMSAAQAALAQEVVAVSGVDWWVPGSDNTALVEVHSAYYFDFFTEFVLEKVVGTNSVPENKTEALSDFVSFANNCLRNAAREDGITLADALKRYNNYKSLAWLRKMAYLSLGDGLYRRDKRNWAKRRRKCKAGKWGRKA